MGEKEATLKLREEAKLNTTNIWGTILNSVKKKETNECFMFRLSVPMKWSTLKCAHLDINIRKLNKKKKKDTTYTYIYIKYITHSKWVSLLPRNWKPP